MPFEIAEIIELDGTVDSLVCVKVFGTLSVNDERSVQDAARKLIEKGRNVRCLLLLEQFSGWKKGDAWGDLSFLMEHGNSVTKVAVVGDPAWKETTFLFLGKGIRQTEIEFFSPELLSKADAWIRA